MEEEKKKVKKEKNLNESWKDIEGYEELYQISNYGRVKSLGRSWIKPNCKIQNFKVQYKKEKILKPHINKNTGYVQIILRKNKKQKMFLIHRLVAQAFIPNPNNFNEVNHKNMNKEDNSINNLEWTTRSENMKHAVKNNNNYLEKLRKHIKSLKPYSKWREKYGK